MLLFTRTFVIILSLVFFPFWIVMVMMISTLVPPLSLIELTLTGKCKKTVNKADRLMYDKCGTLFFDTIEKFSEMSEKQIRYRQ